MTGGALWPVLVLLAFLSTSHASSNTNLFQTSKAFGVQYIGWNQLSDVLTNGSTIVIGADNYLSLFIWKDLNISTWDEFKNSQQRDFSVFTYDLTLTQSVFTNLFDRNLRVGNRTFNSYKFRQVKMDGNTECLYGSVFENHDILIGTPLSFVERLRFARNHRGLRRPSSDYINPNDFTVIPLFPMNFWIYDTSSQSSPSDVTARLLQDLTTNTTIDNLSCLQSTVHDARVIEHLHGMMNFSDQDLLHAANFINVTNIPSDRSYLESAISQYGNISNVWWSASRVNNELWPSTCYYCTTSSCVGERWLWNDTLDLIITLLGLVFYGCLFGSRFFLSPVIRRRFAIVYVAPLMIMVLFLSSINAFNSACVTLASLATVYAASVIVFIYIFTVVRFFYLRNLYNIIKNSKKPKFHKYLAGTSFGVVFTAILPFIVGLIFVIPSTTQIQTYNSNNWNIPTNTIALVLSAISCIMGVLCVVIDVFVSRKSIREKGKLDFTWLFDVCKD